MTKPKPKPTPKPKLRSKDEHTSPEIATIASKLLREKNTSKEVKRVAGSALNNAEDKPKAPPKKAKKPGEYPIA